MSAAGTRRLSSRAAALGALGVYTALAVLWFRASWFHSPGAPQQIGVKGDPGVLAWHMAWVPFAVGHGHNPLFTDYLMAPAGANLLESTSILLPAAVLSPVTTLFNPIVAYNLLATASIAFSGWAAYLVCRRFTVSRAAAFVCGLVYGFSPYMQSQSLSHMNFSVALFPPLALAMLHELLIRQQRSPTRVGALLGVGAFLQMLTGSELLATTVIMALVLIAILSVIGREKLRTHRPYAVRGLLVATAVGLALGGGFLLFSLLNPQHVSGLRQPRNTFVSDPLGLLLPSRYQFFSTSSIRSLTDGFSGFNGEFSTYLGIPLLALVAVAVWRRRTDRVMQVAAAMFAVAVIFSLGGLLHVGGHKLPIPLPWIVLTHVPVLEDILPSRLMVFAYLAAGIIIALFIEDTTRKRRARATGWASVCVAVMSMMPVVTAPSHRVTTPEFFSSAAIEQIPRDSTILATPIFGYSQLPMLWQFTADFRFRLAQGAVTTKRGFGTPTTPVYQLVTAIEGGHSLNQTPGSCQGAPASISAACADLVRADLRNLGITAIVVGEGPHSAELSRFFEDLLGEAPQRTGGISLWIVHTAGPAGN